VLGGMDAQHCVLCAESSVASCGCAVGSSTGAGAGARGAGATGEEGRCVGWSHQVMRVSLGRAGRCRVSSGCPGLDMRLDRGWCVLGAYNGCTNHDCRFVLGIVSSSAAGGGHGWQDSEPASTGKHRHMAPVEECG
jgi:hypothetical protein